MSRRVTHVMYSLSTCFLYCYPERIEIGISVKVILVFGMLQPVDDRISDGGEDDLDADFEDVVGCDDAECDAPRKDAERTRHNGEHDAVHRLAHQRRANGARPQIA